MMKAMQALSDWIEQFGLPVYPTTAVPDDATLPYITIPLTDPEWSQKASFYIQPWYRTESNATVIAKADEIVAAIGTGVIIPYTGGYLVIWPETPLIQVMVDGDFRSAVINLSINSYHMPGV